MAYVFIQRCRGSAPVLYRAGSNHAGSRLQVTWNHLTPPQRRAYLRRARWVVTRHRLVWPVRLAQSSALYTLLLVIVLPVVSLETFLVSTAGGFAIATCAAAFRFAVRQTT